MKSAKKTIRHQPSLDTVALIVNRYNNAWNLQRLSNSDYLLTVHLRCDPNLKLTSRYENSCFERYYEKINYNTIHSTQIYKQAKITYITSYIK